MLMSCLNIFKDQMVGQRELPQKPRIRLYDGTTRTHTKVASKTILWDNTNSHQSREQDYIVGQHELSQKPKVRLQGRIMG